MAENVASAPFLFRRCKELRHGGHTGEALRLLREALRRRTLAPDEIVQAGRLIATSLAGGPAEPGDVTVLILGQCTTSWLVPTLTAVAFGRGGIVTAHDVEYDNVIQGLLRLSEGPDVNRLAPVAPASSQQSGPPPYRRAAGWTKSSFWPKPGPSSAILVPSWSRSATTASSQGPSAITSEVTRTATFGWCAN